MPSGPITKNVITNSSNESAKARHVAPTSSGQICGIVTRQKRSQPFAPRSAAASSRAGSSRSSAAIAISRKYGNTYTQWAMITVVSERSMFTRTKNTSIERPMNRPGRVIGRKNSSASGPRSRERVRAIPNEASVPSRSVMTAVQAATNRLFSSAERKPGSESTKRYQRSEKPVNGQRQRARLVEREQHHHGQRHVQEQQGRDRDRERAPGAHGHEKRTRSSFASRRPTRIAK